MPAKKIQLKPPSTSTIQKLKEVKFYLIYQILKTYVPHQHTHREALLENFCDVAGLTASEKTRVLNMVSQFAYARYVPSKLELALAIHYFQIPINPICRDSKVMTAKTYYVKLNEYMELGQYDLAPMYDADTHAAITSFVMMFERFLDLMSPLTLARGMLNYATD